MASQLLLAVISFLPALGIIYFVLGAQERFFRHQAMFLALIGGLVLGLLASIAEVFILSDASVVFIIVSFPLVETMAKTMFVGLPRFRDEDETVLLGGAAGATMAAMLMIFYAQSVVQQPVTWQLLVKLVGAALGLTGAHFVSGLRLGLGPARGSLLSGFLPSLGWLAPAHLFLGLLGLGVVEGLPAIRPLQGDWFWALPLAIYGIAIFIWRTPPLVAKGLPREERRKILREGAGF